MDIIIKCKSPKRAKNKKRKYTKLSEGRNSSIPPEKKVHRNKRHEVLGPVHIGQFLKDYKIILPDAGSKNEGGRPKKGDDSSVSSLLGVPMSLLEFEKLKRFCSTDKLDVPHEPPILDIDSLRANRFSSEETSRNGSRGQSKYKSSKWLDIPTKGRRDLRIKDDVVLVVRVYEPVRKYSRGSRICNPPPVFLYDLAVLGSQTLDTLRDKINCVSDWSVLEGVCENSDKQSKAKDVYKSGFFFIEGVFYNDFRHHKNHDYSEVIRNFSKEKGQSFKTAVMEETRFLDLSIRFGYPYLYQHQGECKHVVMFTDARLLHDSDSLVSRNYPYHLRIVRKMSHLCMVCKMHTARWVTHDNNRTCVDYCYFCDNCFRSFNYIFRRKIGNFRAYRYYDRAIVL